MSYEGNLSSFDALVDIIARLRGPQGCPWDRKQTHLSLKPSLVEECYEVLEAIDHDDSRKLREELGDLLMHIVLHAQIATDQGDFYIKDVLQEINAKLIYRHPHVFGEAKLEDEQMVVERWEELKREERGKASLLSGLPKIMPALAYSQAMQRRAARVGFDWRNVDDVIEKLVEEINELRQATNYQEKTEEFGDLLFSLANVARWLGIELEDALRLTNAKFYQRFCYMEELCLQRGLSLNKLSLEEQNKLWDEAKRHVSNNDES